VSISVSIDHLNLSVINFDETAKWYYEIFNFQIVEQGTSSDGQPWGILKSESTMLCIYQMKERVTSQKEDRLFNKYHHISHFGFKINDRIKWEKILADRKLVVLYGGAIEYPHSTSWYVQDPSGYEIEISIWSNNQIKF
jgi:catechol-2,3-dioxygenase